MGCVNNEDVRKLKTLFDLHDTNSDGGIEIMELDIILRYLHQASSLEQLKKLFTDADLDDSGKISFPEFCTLMGIDYDASSEQNTNSEVAEDDSIIEKSFSIFDTNKDSVISLTELDQLIQFLDQKRTTVELVRILSSVDEDNSGTINLSEFQKLLAKIADSHSSEEDSKSYQKFAQIDKDSNGFLSVDELYSELTRGGEEITPLQMKKAFNLVDSNENGWVDFEEFVKITK